MTNKIFSEPSEGSYGDWLIDHVAKVEKWQEDCHMNGVIAAKQENPRDALRSWYKDCFYSLIKLSKGNALADYINVRFDKKQYKDVICRAVNSVNGSKLQAEYGINAEEHKILEECEINALTTLNQEYATLKDRIPCRCKKTRALEYYLSGISVDELRALLPQDMGERGAKAKFCKVVAHEYDAGHITRIYNPSEFQRSLVEYYGAEVPSVQQLSRELRKVVDN